VTPNGALPGTFTVTLTVSGSAGVYLAMTVDEFNYATGATNAIDSSGMNAQAAATSMSLASALTVSGIDLIYVAGSSEVSGTVSPGSGFTMAYNAQMISSQTYGIASEYLFPQTSNINRFFRFRVCSIIPTRLAGDAF
jgi:hypothetical protein